MNLKNEKQFMKLYGLPSWMPKTSSDFSEMEDKISKGNLVECPHCNGYGSSFKDPEDQNTCRFCGGSGVVTPKMAERYPLFTSV